MKGLFLNVIILFMALSAAAQTAVYAESFRHGSTMVLEESYEVKLTPQDAVYKERIKDSHGADRYVFSITPRGPVGDSKITSWEARLADLRHPIYDNVLLASQNGAAGPDDPKDSVWQLQPGRFASVAIGAKRIIKVENFYVVLHVTACHFTPLDSPYLDSMAVDVEFRNTDPGKADAPEK